eukprot:CAMPEP_0173189372 /NCGR_PEP_ID=MMETSP1141-20130122/11759_1 /TAXON_ID=483371 /ORGANISM="non described non described, Strain CCMP2298" /LENGTH=82 /DNA_ID=CAMNT_0014113375 /DNA_START=43 /DNA_END=288 /DNA_ORIENTATION=-
MNRHCDKCNLEVLSGSVLSTLCLDGAAHHLVDNVAAPAVQQAPVPTAPGLTATAPQESLEDMISRVVDRVVSREVGPLKKSL